MRQLVLGIDVGGTNIKLGIIDRKGKILARNNLVTKSYTRNKKNSLSDIGKTKNKFSAKIKNISSSEAVNLINAIIEGVKNILADNNLGPQAIIGIGIGLPGLIDPQKGIVRFLPNIPGWKDVALKSLLEKELRIPVFIENDVNLITLGEWKFGAGVGVNNMVCMTLGTGVGAGLILNNTLYRGEGFVAGELGHMPLNEKGPGCNCGGFGCFERSVGNKYLEQKAARIFKKKIKLPDIGKLAAQGNKPALAFWEETAVHIGNGLVGAVNLLNPTRIIIGGGVSNNYRFMNKTIEKVIKARAMKVQAAMVKIRRAKLGDDAGIVGARVLVNEIN